MRREWRLQAGLAFAAFEAFEQPGLFAANIRAGAAMQVELKIPARAAGVLADQAGVVGLVDRRLQALCLVIKLAADIDVASVDTHADRGEQAAFDQLVRVVADDVPVLAGARLALIGIDAKVGRTVALLGHERPFQAGRETGAAAPAQPGFLDLLDDPIAPFEDQLLGAVPIAALLGARKPPIIAAVKVGEYPILVGKHCFLLLLTADRPRAGLDKGRATGDRLGTLPTDHRTRQRRLAIA